MGWGSILGNVAKFAGDGVGAMFGDPALGHQIGGVADVIGGMAKSGQAENQSKDSLKILLERAKLDRDKYALTAPGTRMGTSMRASMANNFTPTKVDWGPGGFQPGMGAKGILPRITGGAAGALANLNPETRNLNDQVMHDMNVSQQRGGTTGGGRNTKEHPDGYGTDMAMPELSKSSKLDKFLGGTGSILSLIAAMNKGRNGRPSASEVDD